MSDSPKLSDKIDSQWEESENLKNINCSFEFAFITEEKVKLLISEIKVLKSTAVNNLSSRILKDAFQVLTVELTNIYNLCIESGIFPKAWSVGKITLIPKTCTISNHPKYWRPITQIPLPGKLLERILRDQIYQYFSENNLFYKQQFGF